MYSRFLIPELKPEIDKAIYSDVDVIFLGDIAEMYNEDLAGCALGAVWEEFNERCENIRRKKQLSLTNSHKYFSSGNLLLDCKKWRKSAIADKLINLHNSLNNNSTTPDQDILNKYFECNYKQLPTRYCWTNQCCNYYTNQNFVIRPFNGPIKPWHINGDKYVQILPNLSDFWHYAKLTSFYKKLHNITTNTQVQLVLTRKLQLQQAVQKQIYKISQKKAIV